VSVTQRIARSFRRAFGGIWHSHDEDGWLLRAVGGGRTSAGVHVSEWNALESAPVWAAVTLIADCIASLPVQVIERRDDRRAVVNDHPAAALLNGAINDFAASGTLICSTQTHALLWGNGFAEIERNGRGEPIGLFQLDPSATKPQLTKGENDRRRLQFRTSLHGESAELPARDVLHVFGYSHDGISGISPVLAHRNAIGLATAMEEFGAKFFANDAKSGGFLMHPGKLNDKARENIRGSFGSSEGGQSGLENAHKIKVLDEGMKFVPTSVSPEDSQFLGSREFQLAEAARIYRVPLVLLQSLQGSTVWGTGIEQLMIGFSRWTLGPWVRRWEQEMTRKLLSDRDRRAGLTIKMNLNALMRGDSAARAAFYKAGIVDGWLTRNEVRQKEDMNPIDGLDEPLLQANMMPISEPAQPAARSISRLGQSRQRLLEYVEGRAA